MRTIQEFQEFVVIDEGIKYCAEHNLKPTELSSNDKLKIVSKALERIWPVYEFETYLEAIIYIQQVMTSADDGGSIPDEFQDLFKL